MNLSTYSKVYTWQDPLQFHATRPYTTLEARLLQYLPHPPFLHRQRASLWGGRRASSAYEKLAPLQRVEVDSRCRLNSD